MADIARLEQALRNADAAGDGEAAKIFAAEIRRMQATQPSAPQNPNMAELSQMTMKPDFSKEASKELNRANDQQANRAAYEALPAWKKPFVAANDMGNIIASGVTGGLVNSAAAGIRAPFTDKSYSEELDALNQQLQASRDRAGSAGVVGEIGANVYGVGKLAKAGGTAAKLIPQGLTGARAKIAAMLAGGADGLAINEVMNVGAGNDFGENAGTAAAFGAAAPMVGNALGALGSKVMGAFNKAPKQMTVDQLKDAAQAAYQQADNAGVVYSPDAIKRATDKLKGEFADFGFDPALQPKAAAAFQRLQSETGNNVTLKGLDTIRKVAGNAYDPMNKSNNALTSKVTGAIDDLIQNPQAGDVLMGDGQAASVAMKQARELYGRSAKLEKVNYLLQKAGLNAGSAGSGGNIENATRQQIKTLLTNPKNTRGFSKDEIDALKKAVLGTKSQNALRLAGKLSPQGNGLMLYGGGLATMANPYIGIPVMAGGYVSKKAAERMTASNVKKLQALIAAGGKKETLQTPKNAAQKAIESNKALIARMLMGGSIPMLANSNAQ